MLALVALGVPVVTALRSNDRRELATVVAASVVLIVLVWLRARSLVRERGVARTKQHEAEERFNALVEQLPIASYIATLDDPPVILYVSPQVRELVDDPQNDLGSDIDLWRSQIHPDDRQRVVAAAARHRATGEPLEVEYRFTTADGRLVWLSNRARVLRDERGRPLMSLGVIEDVSRRKRVEEELGRSQRSLETIVTHAPLVLWAVDRNAVFVLSEGAALTELGVRPGEVNGKSVYEVFADDPGVHSHVRRSLSGEEVHEVVQVRGRSLQAWATPLMEHDRVVGAIGVAIDVTDRKRLEQQLRHSQKMEAVGRLAGGVAHDFNNILGVIRNAAAFIGDELVGDEPAASDVNRIVRAVDRGAALTSSLLAFASGREAHDAVADLKAELSELQGLLEGLVLDNVALTVDCGSGRLVAAISPEGFSQIVMNLVTNAVDAMPDGGELTVRLSSSPLSEVSDAPRGMAEIDYVCFSVIDSGVGMHDDAIGKIFEPFFTTKTTAARAGLGLAIVHGIVRDVGGHVGVSSAPGHGTAFEVHLPASAAEPPQAQLGEPSSPGVHGRGENVLVVEDLDDMRTTTARLLIRHGYNVEVASSAENALETLAVTDGIDLIVADVVLPGMSGIDLARKAGVETVLVSGYPGNARAVADGGMEVLLKPFTEAELLKAVARRLEGGDQKRHVMGP